MKQDLVSGTPTRWVTSPVVAAVAATTVSVIQVPLVGALAVFMQAELGFGDQLLGLSVGLFFGASALASTPGGQLGERLGPHRALVLGVSVTVAVLLAIAVVVRSPLVLAGLLALGGVANGVIQPAANLALASEVRRERRGLVFGVKQAAVPAAALLAGLAVPAIGLTIGWRWAYVLVLVMAIPVFLYARGPDRPRSSGSESGRGTLPVRPLVVLAAGAGLAAGGSNSLQAFIVPSFVAGGFHAGTAGLILAAGSALGIVTRLLSGWMADRRTGAHLEVVAAMLALGAVGFVLLATAGGLALVVGALLAFGAGWGWPGLFIFAVVDKNMQAPAAATGITLTGTYVGGSSVPVLFGLVSAHVSYAAGWVLVAVAVSVGAILLLIGSSMMRRLVVDEPPRDGRST